MTPTQIFLGGAPKCGTSSLFAALAGPDAVTTPLVKEPFFYLDAGHPLLNSAANVHLSDAGSYEDLYLSAEAPYRLDGTTHLIFQRDMPKLLAERYPTAHFIFVLRNPIDRLYSSFNYTLNNLSQFRHPVDFPTYARLVLEGRGEALADHMVQSTSRYVLSHDLAYGRYADYISSWYAAVPSERIMLIEYGGYRHAPDQTLRSIAQWLGLDPDTVRNQGRKNSTVGIRNFRLHRMARSLGKRMAGGGLKTNLKRLYYLLQSRKRTERDDIPPALRAELNDYYADSNRELTQTYGVEHGWQ